MYRKAVKVSTPSSPAGDRRHPGLAPLLREAAAAHEAGRLDDAVGLYRRFVDDHPEHPTGLQLLGLAHSQRGEYEPAIACMRESLRLFPEQAEVANNLGNALSASGRIAEAIDSYTLAVRLLPRYTEAWRNLGSSQLAQGLAFDAAASFTRCVEADPRDAAGWLGLGNAHKRQGDLEGAIDCYGKALALRPGYAEAHHNLGVCKRLQNRPEEALMHYDRARRLGLDRAELHHNRGNALADTLEVDAAIEAWRAAIERNPLDLESHRNLSSLLWQQERLDEHLGSYREALAAHPAALPLQLAYATALNQGGAFEEAEQAVLQALPHCGRAGALLGVLAHALEGQGRWEQALALHGAAAAMPDAVPDQRVSYARALLACRRPEEALVWARSAAAQRPHDQRALAYLGLCWRMLGDPRERTLNDYSSLVRVFDVPVPAPFSSAADFNERLDEALARLHFARRHPPEQTLRGGTQTSGNLFARRDPVIRALVDGLAQCVREYIGGLRADREHPFLARRSGTFGFSASWSVRLRRAGYHTMHMHPMGWISSAYYVHVPPEIAGAGDRGGALKFGEPDIDVGEDGAARRYVTPAVGRLVLFPSYMWHGTVPFESDEPRTTVAFDVVPAR